MVHPTASHFIHSLMIIPVSGIFYDSAAVINSNVQLFNLQVRPLIANSGDSFSLGILIGNEVRGIKRLNISRKSS